MPTPRQTPPTTLPTLHTAEAAAELTGLPLRVIRDAMYTRVLPTVKIGRRVYVTADALAAWIAAASREAQ